MRPNSRSVNRETPTTTDESKAIGNNSNSTHPSDMKSSSINFTPPARRGFRSARPAKATEYTIMAGTGRSRVVLVGCERKKLHFIGVIAPRILNWITIIQEEAVNSLHFAKPLPRKNRFLS
ncbi:unnamed protein product [Lasius platythorax]|uniref:Uncharacterized protein n=1 Tax=Lasius platythorax TaxID=488582 RepID=A0AAV2NJM1_9HYME